MWPSSPNPPSNIVNDRWPFLLWGLCALTIVLCVGTSGQAQASDQWSTPHPGIRLLERTTGAPNQIYALEIDLCRAGVTPRATAPGQRGRTTSNFGNLANAHAAINGDFFSGGFEPTGLAVGNGNHWSGSTDHNWTGFVALGHDRAEIFGTGGGVTPVQGWMREVVSGRPQVVTEGEALTSSDDSICTGRHPRTAVGLSRDLRTLYLVVVDGRSSTSVGMTCTELATLMRNLGAYNAVNLDGGGSSTMWVRGQGLVNQPSDGSQRTVANHLAVIASGQGPAGACDPVFDDTLHQIHVYEEDRFIDIDGDGIADMCIRGAAGMRCYKGTGEGFGPQIDGPSLSDDNGWGNRTNYSTIRMGDVTGDGRTDICARANGGYRCWPSTGDGFSSPIPGPPLTNGNGFAQHRFYSTIRLADVTGDGRDDFCVRTSNDFRCWPSTGDGVGEAIIGPGLADGSGWQHIFHYGTIRMGDVTGDGRADLCARGGGGIRCWPSTGDGFAPSIDGPAWSNASGWDDFQYWSTIRLADIDGDGRADICARSATGYRCHLSTGDGFGPAHEIPALSDDNGWGRYRFYSTIRIADVTGDGTQDVCARAAAGFRCWLWTGDGFGDSFTTTILADDEGWHDERYFRTIRLADITGNGRADLCARGVGGVRCWPSTGDGFGSSYNGPALTNSAGWDAVRYYSTLRLGGVAPPSEPPDEDPPEADTGVDTGVAPMDVGGEESEDVGEEVGIAGGEESEEAGTADASGGSPTTRHDTVPGASDAGQHSPDAGYAQETSSCACSQSPGGGLAPLIVVGLFLLSRRTPRTSREP